MKRGKGLSEPVRDWLNENVPEWRYLPPREYGIVYRRAKYNADPETRRRHLEQNAARTRRAHAREKQASSERSEGLIQDFLAHSMDAPIFVEAESSMCPCQRARATVTGYCDLCIAQGRTVSLDEEVRSEIKWLAVLADSEVDCYLKCLGANEECWGEAVAHWHGFYKETPRTELYDRASERVLKRLTE